MYTLLESLRSALYAIRAHKLRSILTTLGITIGVTAVVAVVSLIQGFSQSISNQFEGLGSNSLIIQSYLPFKERLAGKVARITPEDLLAIQHGIPGISGITPILPLGPFGTPIQYQNRSTTARVLGTTPALALWYNQYPDRGRFITPGDDLAHRRVAVVGATVASSLHLPENPIGTFIQIGGQWFKVIGMLHKLGSILGNDQDNRVIIPYGTAHSLLGAATRADIFIQLKVNDLRHLDATAGRIRELLRRRHGLKSGQADDFKVQTAEQFTDSFRSILNIITGVLGGIVAISLVVGGIGIMNIMLVSVTERTREIGILKSLGARRRDILLQFLIEAAALALLGGLIGLVFGYGLGTLVVHAVPAFRGAHVPLWAVVLAIGFSAGTGVLFGIAPAAKAAALDPIEALRYE